MPALRVGLTGGLASGKSTVARWLGEAGFAVVDADRLVAELYRPGEPGARTVTSLFGPEYLEPSGAVDRVKLGGRIFSDATARAALERAVHPLVRQRFATWARGQTGVVVLEATRLVEAGFAPDFDLVVSCEAPAELRLGRAVARGLAEPDARARLAAQGDGAERRAAAHRLLDNSGSLGDLRRATDELIVELRRLAASR